MNASTTSPSTSSPGATSQGLIVAFHTTDPLYTREAERLGLSARKLGLPLSLTTFAPGSWLDIVRLKAGFLLDKRRSERGPLLYVDVDAVIHSDPWALLTAVDGDVAFAVFADGKARSGTMYFADTEGALRFIEDWIQRLQNAPGAWDQHPLDDIVREQKTGAQLGYRVAGLSPSLCYIFDKAEKTGAVGHRPVIEHLQASRDVKSRGRDDQLRREQRVRELEVEMGMREEGEDRLDYAVLSDGDRRKRTQAMLDAGQSDRPRWANTDNLKAGWDERASAVARLISPPGTVLDLGCGAMALEKELAPGVVYVPADLVSRDERTLVFDANSGRLPDQDADVVTALGVLEYIHDPQAFFTSLARWPRVVLTYNPADLDEGRDRRPHGWFNALTVAEVIAMAVNAGFRLDGLIPFAKRQRIFDLGRA
ncbi:MAG TPA: putative nucleotide-diphospho-sugar transferase [Hyphomonadaceae bacterium]|jgi:hypothetical protein|nr:putative nucleotide-diphospho-sugar transferase [Hyphomonadaceae bacterium]